MKHSAVLIAITMVASLALPAISSAQAPADKTAPMTGIKPDRTIADPATRKAMHEKEAALKHKRADCRAKAKAEKIALLKRLGYVRDCMSQ